MFHQSVTVSPFTFSGFTLRQKIKKHIFHSVTFVYFKWDYLFCFTKPALLNVIFFYNLIEFSAVVTLLFSKLGHDASSFSFVLLGLKVYICQQNQRVDLLRPYQRS